MTTVSRSIGEILLDSFNIAEKLREKKEARARASILDPDKEEREQRKFERSIGQFGIFPHGRGMKIA
ncbi:MAG TPA: hypothetical protein VJI96_03580 [Candidatus Andersenbacteria bacterium]|nr:hypothetical protein [Candidatus Andersenbacteria bacterium]